MISRQTSLSRNIVQFCRFLRQRGFTLSADEEATALSALRFIDYRSNDVFRQALKAVLCRSRSQLDEFDGLFKDYWKELEKAVDAKEKKQARPEMKPGVNKDNYKALKSWLSGNKNDEVEQTASYSTHQNMSQQDFSSVPADELDEVMKSIRALSRRLAAQSTRRYEKSARVNLPDLRQTLRKNMRHGGELVHIMFRKPKRNRTKLVVLCDVSQSMDLYSAFLLQFMYSFQQVYRRIETFAFSTSLQSVTQLLKEKDFSSAMRTISAQNKSWSGGTRIGESLHQFVTEYGRLLDKRTIIIILSDGWDTGEVSLLEKSMAFIYARSKKVIWLNPLAGYVSYRPSVAGMQAALPYVHVFAPVHNIDSLRRLGKWL